MQLTEVPALGRVAKLGDIYDAKINAFTGVNAFQINPENSFIIPTENPNSSFKFSFATRESDKLDAMDISGELKVNILCGLIELGGSAKYIKNDKNTQKFIQCSYILKTKTIKESVNWNLKEFAKFLDFDGIEGTHMVVGIQYGGNAVVTLQYTANDSNNSMEIQGCLKAKLETIQYISGELNAAGQINKREKLNENELSISVEADVSIDGEDVTKVEGATKFMQNLGTKLQKYNGGKGVQVAFELVSLEQIFKTFKMKVVENQVFRALDNGIMSDIVRELHELEKIKEELTLHIYILEDDKEYFTKTEHEWLYDEKTKFDILISDIQVNIAKTLKLFHEKDPSAYSVFKEQSARVSKLKKDVYNFDEQSDTMETKAEFIKKAKANKALYINQKRKLENLKWRNKNLQIFLFCEKYYRENLNTLIDFIHESNSNKTENIYILIDIDILRDFIKNELRLNEMPKNPLYSYINGMYHVVEDNNEEDVIVGIGFHDMCFYANYYKDYQFHEFSVEMRECGKILVATEKWNESVDPFVVILHVLKTRVEEKLKKAVKNVILTVSSGYKSKNIIRVLNAVQILHINVLEIIYEENAIALSQLIPRKKLLNKTICIAGFTGYTAVLQISENRISLIDCTKIHGMKHFVENLLHIVKTNESSNSAKEHSENSDDEDDVVDFEIVYEQLDRIIEAFIACEEEITLETDIGDKHFSITLSKNVIEKMFKEKYQKFFESIEKMLKENTEITELLVVGTFGLNSIIQSKFIEKLSLPVTFLPSGIGAKGAAIFGASLYGHFKTFVFKTQIPLKKDELADNNSGSEIATWKKEKISFIEYSLSAEGELLKKYSKKIKHSFDDVEEEREKLKKLISQIKWM